jgi:putative hemolysin
LQGDILIEVIIILLLLVLNGFFAASEIAMVSSSKPRLKKLAVSGNKRAAAALNLSRSPNTFLSTVQVGITLVGIFAGAFGGASLAGNLSVVLADISFIAPYADTISFILIVIMITYLSLIIGELAPKRLAMNNPESLALLAAKPMTLLSKIAKPFIWVLSISTDAILKLLRYKPSDRSAISEEEIKILVDEGTQSGVIDQTEKEIIDRVFKAGDMDVSGMMTIRQDVIFIDKDEDESTIKETLLSNEFSRYPVYEDNFDNVIGMVDARDMLKLYVNGRSKDFSEVMYPCIKIKEDTPALHLLKMFKENQDRIAVVVDDNGGTEGIVTMGDLVNAIVGDPEREDDSGIKKLNDKEYILSGSLPVDDLKNLLNIKDLPEEEEYKTVAGFFMTNLNAVPKTNFIVEWDSYRMRVIEMQGNRVLKVKLRILDKPF